MWRKKKRRLFPRGRKKRKKEDEEEIEDKHIDGKEKDLSKPSDDMEGDPANFYRQLSDDDEMDGSKSGSKKHEEEMIHSRNYWKSAHLDEI